MNEERDAGEAWALYRLQGEPESLYWPHDNGLFEQCAMNSVLLIGPRH